MTNTFPVTVFDLDSQLFSGQAVAVSSVNEVGPFDVLGLHMNFISQIQEKLVIHLTDTQKKEILVESGVLRCLETHVSVYIVESTQTAA